MYTRYVKQADDYSCGPIAIYNALIALGHPPQSFRWIRKDCDPHPVYGTLYSTMNSTLRKHLPNGIDCQYVRRPSFELVKSHVRDGGIVIICEHWEENSQVTGEHYYTIIGMQGTDFLAVNRDDSRKKNNLGKELKNVQLVTPRQLRTSLIHHDVEEYPENCLHETSIDDLLFPTVWLLSKKSRKRKREAEDTDEYQAKRSACTIT